MISARVYSENRDQEPYLSADETLPAEALRHLRQDGAECSASVSSFEAVPERRACFQLLFLAFLQQDVLVFSKLNSVLFLCSSRVELPHVSFSLFGFPREKKKVRCFDQEKGLENEDEDW